MASTGFQMRRRLLSPKKNWLEELEIEGEGSKGAVRTVEWTNQLADLHFVAKKVVSPGYATGQQGSYSSSPWADRRFHNCVDRT